MTCRKPGISRLCRAMAFFLCLCCLSLPAAAEGSAPVLSLSVPQTVWGYSECTITVDAPAAGEAMLRLYDSLGNPWLVRRETLSAGKNELAWDGLGANRERLFVGPYRFDVTLSGEDGKEYSASAAFSIINYRQALALALPSSETLYLDQGENWFVECWVPSRCIVTMEVLDAGGKIVYTKNYTLEDEDKDIIRWDGVSARKKLAPGSYTVRLYARPTPGFDWVYPLTIGETTPEKPVAGITGAVIPERDMSDEETWEIMMKPSVVIDAKGSASRFPLRESPDERSAAVAQLCCATQGLEVLAVEGGWARVRAADYSNGALVTGWYPLSGLTVCSPAPHYAVLVDKRYQTLTLWQDGKPVWTVPVSTGLGTEAHPERETSPGAFLTDVHYSPDFGQDGLRYDCPLRYQGGNIIHSTGYVRIPHAAYSVKDYSKNLPLLGQKSSHGCVRVSPFADADCPVNSYWLWTHLPYHTRIVILDD